MPYYFAILQLKLKACEIILILCWKIMQINLILIIKRHYSDASKPNFLTIVFFVFDPATQNNLL